MTVGVKGAKIFCMLVAKVTFPFCSSLIKRTRGSVIGSPTAYIDEIGHPSMSTLSLTPRSASFLGTFCCTSFDISSSMVSPETTSISKRQKSRAHKTGTHNIRTNGGFALFGIHAEKHLRPSGMVRTLWRMHVREALARVGWHIVQAERQIRPVPFPTGPPSLPCPPTSNIG